MDGLQLSFYQSADETDVLEGVINFAVELEARVEAGDEIDSPFGTGEIHNDKGSIVGIWSQP